MTPIDPTPALLERFPDELRPNGPLTYLGDGGGTSGSTLWRYRSQAGEQCLRHWSADGPSPFHLGRVHHWLAHLHDISVVAVPHRDLFGATLIETGDGGPWELAPWRPGEPDLDRPVGRERLRVALMTLARVHQRLAEIPSEPDEINVFAPSPGLVRRRDEIERMWLRGQARRLAALVTGLDAESRLARDWLRRAEPLALRVAPAIARAAPQVVPIQVCLRDLRPDHFLFEGDRLTGLIDFAAMDRDTIAGDLARLLGLWVGDAPDLFEEALRAYRSIHLLDTDDLSRIDAFRAGNAVLGGFRWIAWHFRDRRRFDDPEAVRAGLSRQIEMIGHVERLELH